MHFFWMDFSTLPPQDIHKHITRIFALRFTSQNHGDVRRHIIIGDTALSRQTSFARPFMLSTFIDNATAMAIHTVITYDKTIMTISI